MRLKYTGTALGLLMIATGLSIACHPAPQASPRPKVSIVHKAPDVTTTTYDASDPQETRLPDCEDQDATPCVTWDEGGWRMISSYSPYSHTDLWECMVEDGGPILPCVWRDQDTDGNWIVFTAS